MRAEDLPPFDVGIPPILRKRAKSWARKLRRKRGAGFWSRGREIEEDMYSGMALRVYDSENFKEHAKRVREEYAKTDTHVINGEPVEVVNHSWLIKRLNMMCYEVLQAEELALADQHAPELAGALRTAATSWCAPSQIQAAKEMLTGDMADDRYVVDRPVSFLQMVHTARATGELLGWAGPLLFSKKGRAAQKAAGAISAELGGTLSMDTRRQLTPSGERDAETPRPRRTGAKNPED